MFFSYFFQVCTASSSLFQLKAREHSFKVYNHQISERILISIHAVRVKPNRKLWTYSILYMPILKIGIYDNINCGFYGPGILFQPLIILFLLNPHNRLHIHVRCICSSTNTMPIRSTNHIRNKHADIRKSGINIPKGKKTSAIYSFI